ncbi:hypothetical protein C8A05DRAFT_29434 [Staphylotrichum tortipilum]|uniref:Uncharacterized protein n=1 Tax=Staphylotrichum tortipilum TaxID=2831512 RepID=A0AAN6MT98_9PEZI|nr:hypothetical protein C8A05DRAFT_29434 [Staphylotrichum longicolle]
MAIANTRPPPPPTSLYQPQQQQQQAPPQHPPQQLHSAQPPPNQRRRKSRTLSFRSDKSQGSGKIDLHETSAEKEAKRLHSKADPTLAMQEAEPSEVAAFGKSTAASLRSIQHRDANGNPIADPDRSNPTRNRWERPLDTIRSFEAAIDGGYSNRRSIIRPDEGTTWGPSRRTSYYNGNGNGNGGRFGHDSYYGSRPPSTMYAHREGSQQDLRMSGTGQQRDNYYDQQSGYGGYGPPPQNGRRGVPRMYSEPQYGNGYRQQRDPNDYSAPNGHRQYETGASASGSGSSAEPAGYQTDPTSSDNSSIERVQTIPRRQPEPVNDYGIGFSQGQGQGQQGYQQQAPAFTQNQGMNGSGNGSFSNNYQVSGAPPPQVPRKESTPVLRKPMAAGQPQPQQPQQLARPAQPEKRKSWFSKRFSKNS